MLKNLLITAMVAAIFGVLGAMGYSHFFGSKSGEPSSSRSKTEAGLSQESSSKTKSDGGPNTDSANASSNQALNLGRDPRIQLSQGGRRAEAADHEPQPTNRSVRRTG